MTTLQQYMDSLMSFSEFIYSCIFVVFSLFLSLWLPRQELWMAWKWSKFLSSQTNQAKHFISRDNPSPFHSLSFPPFSLQSYLAVLFCPPCNYSHSFDIKIWKYSEKSVCNKTFLLLYVSLTLTDLGFFFFLYVKEPVSGPSLFLLIQKDRGK